MFFEGSEKKVEVIVDQSKTGSLRELGRDFWQKMVHDCRAEILSEISNDFCHAFLLSESSLFVWDDSFLMITCGETQLVNSVVSFLEKFNGDCVNSIIFQRKNEYLSHLQKSSFEDDVKRIKKHVDGLALQFGYLDEHHNYMFHMNKNFAPKQSDFTTELLMYHIQGDAADILRTKNQPIEKVKNLLKLDELFSEFQIDDFMFEPYGYSLNGINGDRYITFHITPQEGSSYVSFETNIDIENDRPDLLQKIIDIFRPFSFDLVDFNKENNLHDERYVKVTHFNENLRCGYLVNFSHFIQINKQSEKPIHLDI